MNKTIRILMISFVMVIVGFIIGIFAVKKTTPYVNIINTERLELAREGAKDTLVSEIDKYIQSVAPGSCVNGLAIVDACDEYNIDIKFVLAQGFVEGHFATKGLSAKMNNIFNVGAYDHEGSKYMRYFDHPDKSIDMYLILLKEHYLVDGKTEYDLMDKYVNYAGQRYATDKNYESKIFANYQYIIENTVIEELYCQYKKYKILTHK